MAKFYRPIDIFFAAWQAIESILFFGVSMMTILRIRAHFPPFYKAHKCSLYLVMVGLSLPLMIAAVLNLLS